MDRNKKIGLTWLIAPISTLILSLILFAVSSGVLQSIANNSENSASLDFTILVINMVLSGIGLLAVIGIIIGVPLGAMYLSRQTVENDVSRLSTVPAYRGLTPEQTQFISRWSWGAFFGGIIWALGNRLWLWALLSLVPVINLYVWFKLAIAGRQMSWEQGGWQNFEQFQQRQKTLMWIILIGLAVILILKIATYDPSVR